MNFQWYLHEEGPSSYQLYMRDNKLQKLKIGPQYDENYMTLDEMYKHARTVINKLKFTTPVIVNMENAYGPELELNYTEVALWRSNNIAIGLTYKTKDTYWRWYAPNTIPQYLWWRASLFGGVGTWVGLDFNS